MMRSLFSAVSGLQNHQMKMDVIGNNIANVNTIGYKTSRAYFSEELAMRLSNAKQSAAGGTTNPAQIGLGVSIGAIDRQFTQGIFQTTGKATDLALQGEGFFIVGTSDRSYYTRDDVEFLRSLPKIDILVMHEWPNNMFQGVVPDQLAERFGPELDEIGKSNMLYELILEKQPKHVFSGHMHLPYTGKIGNSTIHCLSILGLKGDHAVVEL